MPTNTQPRGFRLWLFRVAVLLLVPAALLLAAEIVLRLVGFGFPTDFLVPIPGRDGVMTTNQKFTWRFFPPEIARAPVPFELKVEKAAGTYRVFVVGGSAAQGTPEPAFGVARVLETMLEATYPETRFEVENAAVTAINSHVVLSIVRELADYDPDLFVVCLGNNELVGPYGAASVFGTFSPQLGVIRAAVAAKRTRLGQLLNRAQGATAESHEAWRTMELQQIAASDARLEKVYEHLEKNLTDIVRASRGAGAEALLATVPVNLADQPPFSSIRRAGLSEDERGRFEKALEEARDLLRRGENAAVLAGTREAAAIDGGHAEVHFLAGRALLALDRPREARAAFVRARDLDGLRFRADSRINDVIRRVAETEGVALVDAERYFREEAGGALPFPAEARVGEVPLPGRLLFHEHVHLSFAGNYVLARLLLEEIRGLLREPIARGAAATAEPPSFREVGLRLAYTPFDALEMEREILEVVSRPPFTNTLWYAEELAYRRRRLAESQKDLDAGDWNDSRQLYEHRLEARPDDLDVRRRFAVFLTARGEAGAAAEQWHQLVERIPDVASWHEAYALALAEAGRVDEALAELREMLDRFPAWRSRILEDLDSVPARSRGVPP